MLLAFISLIIRSSPSNTKSKLRRRREGVLAHVNKKGTHWELADEVVCARHEQALPPFSNGLEGGWKLLLRHMECPQTQLGI